MKNIIKGSGFLDRVRIYNSFEEIPSTHDLICLNVDNDIVINNQNIDISANNSSNLIGSSEIAVFGNYKITIADNAQAYIQGMDIYNPIDNNWKGFKVRGPALGQDDETGLILNGCTIIGAKTGVSQNIGYPHFGGYIEALATNFDDCFRGIEMMRYSNDKSIIDDCSFNNGEYGVTSWENDITLEQCTFQNISNAGVRGIGSSITVEGNSDLNTPDFINCIYGIRLSWPNGQMNSTDIYDNYFTNNAYDVYVNEGSGIIANYRTNFRSNQSDNSFVSFIGGGGNQLTIQNNNFNSSGICNFLSNNGDEENFIELNNFNNSVAASAFFGDNSFTFFTTNCYDNQSDVDVFVNGKIPNQGNVTEGPGNCFNGNAPELRTGNNGESFTYFVPENVESGLQPCHLVTSEGNFQIEESTDVLDSDGCGVIFTIPTSTNGNTTGHSPCNPNKNEADLYQAIIDIKDLMEEISSNELFSEETKESLLQYYTKCLRKVKLWLVKELIDNKKQTEALHLLKSDPSFNMQIKGYNLLMHQNDYTNADTYLNSLQTLSRDQQAYVYAQNLYLDHLINRSFIPNSTQLSALYQYGLDDNVLSGSIRAIYEYFTDEFIELDLTIEGVNPSQPRNSKDAYDNSNVNVYPNPISGEQMLNIDLSHPMDKNSHVEISIMDFNGSQILERKTKLQNTDIDISNLTSGVYIVVITDQDGNSVVIEKLIVL